MSKIDGLDLLDFSEYLGPGVKAVCSLSLVGDMKNVKNRTDFVNRVFGNYRIIYGGDV